MQHQGIIIYRGPSRIDGSPVVFAANGFIRPSGNLKTGPMIQTYFMVDGLHPVQAVHSGLDFSICGTCRHRGEVITDQDTGRRRNTGRSCYVVLMNGPAQVYHQIESGAYPLVPISEARRMFAGRHVRLGTYGDPACVPFEILKEILKKADGVTGYTHAWEWHPELAEFCMASCDTDEERTRAKSLGFRTFRVRPKGDNILLDGEGHCPASIEMGKATQCVSCMLCGGNRRAAQADITIQAHGVGVNNFERWLKKEQEDVN